MSSKRFKPLIDKIFWLILIPTAILLAGATVVCCFAPISLLIIIPVDLLCVYFIVSPLFGYVELGEDMVIIKYGLLLKREIPYSNIRGVTKERKFYAEGLVSLKNALEHVNIKFNRFDVTSVSVKDNDELIKEIESRM